jgi:hypothetical protein
MLRASHQVSAVRRLRERLAPVFVEAISLSQTVIDCLTGRLARWSEVTAMEQQFDENFAAELINGDTPPAFPSIFEPAQNLD